jgi:hypothetical protein
MLRLPGHSGVLFFLPFLSLVIAPLRPSKIEGSPEPPPIRPRHARAGSVMMTNAPPPSFQAGVITTRSRSSYIRERLRYELVCVTVARTYGNLPMISLK